MPAGPTRTRAAGKNQKGRMLLSYYFFHKYYRILALLPRKIPKARYCAQYQKGLAGEGLLQDGHRVKGEYELEIPVGPLKPGLYLLRLRSTHGHQVVRFVKGN